MRQMGLRRSLTGGLPGERHTLPHDIVCRIKTTLSSADSVMQRSSEEAARRRPAMSALVEAGLRRLLAESSQSDGQPARLPPSPAWNGGAELIDLSDRDARSRAMEEA